MQNRSSKFKTCKFCTSGLKFLFSRISFGCVAAVFLFTGCISASQAAQAKQPINNTAQEVNRVDVSTLTEAQPGVIDSVCDLICRGKFDAAGELIKQSGDQDGQLVRLAEIVAEYKAISARRQAEQEAAYKEQLSELEKLRKAPQKDVNDVNDVNDIVKALSVITQASEFANESQKQELLSDSFVKETFQRAKAKADEFESKGKWLDAYISCYSWLQAIEPNNRSYSDYTEQLADKAGILASFQDSPCETAKERFRGVGKEVFIRVIGALNYNYVNVIDYHQMTVKAVKRCQLLADVVGSASPEILKDMGDSFAPPDKAKLAVFSAELETILNEVNRSLAGVSRDKFMDIFEKVFSLNEATVKLPESVLVIHFSEAALSALDPYTVIVWPTQVQEFEKMMTNEFTGIGIEITKEKGVLTVASLLPDTPAYNSGLDAGDVIEAVDGVQTKDMSLICAVRKITGPAGTKVALTIKRTGEEETRSITITRAKIIVPTIRGWERGGPSDGAKLQNGTADRGRWLYMIDDRSKIGYVRIINFSERTASDLEKALTELESKGMQGLILDLRFNTGGFLSSAVEVADKFLEKGPIVVTRPRFWISSTYASAQKEGTHPDYPLVVLINRFSASASEIVAGALSDKVHNRAVLVGGRTHGKGSVQGVVTYPQDGAQLKYTMAYYYLPSGQRVESQDEMKKRGKNEWGIGPNIEIKLRIDEFKKMVEVQRENDVLVKADHDSGAAPLKRHTIEETLAADPQLAVGVLVVKSKLVQLEKAKSRG